MTAALVLASLPIGFVLGFSLGRRFEAAHQRVAGLLAAGERDTAICDEADLATDGRF